MDIVDDGRCFVCGRENPQGLKLRFELDGDALSATAETSLSPLLTGWKGAAHGGIVAALLDEAMVYACGAAGVYVATANLKIRFRKPVPVGVPLRIEGHVTQHRRRFLQATSRVMHDDRVLAEAEGAMVVMRTITADDPLRVPPRRAPAP